MKRKILLWLLGNTRINCTCNCRFALIMTDLLLCLAATFDHKNIWDTWWTAPFETVWIIWHGGQLVTPLSDKCTLDLSQGFVSRSFPHSRKKKNLISSKWRSLFTNTGKYSCLMYCDHESFEKRNRVKCSPLLSVRSTPPFPQEVYPPPLSLHPSLFLPPLIFADYRWLGGPIRDANEERRPSDIWWCETLSHADKQHC